MLYYCFCLAYGVVVAASRVDPHISETFFFIISFLGFIFLAFPSKENDSTECCVYELQFKSSFYSWAFWWSSQRCKCGLVPSSCVYKVLLPRLFLSPQGLIASITIPVWVTEYEVQHTFTWTIFPYTDRASQGVPCPLSHKFLLKRGFACDPTRSSVDQSDLGIHYHNPPPPGFGLIANDRLSRSPGQVCCSREQDRKCTEAVSCAILRIYVVSPLSGISHQGNLLRVWQPKRTRLTQSKTFRSLF